MRKFVLAAIATVLTFGLTLAGEVLFVSFDPATKELKVKENKDAPETTYKITDDTTFKAGDKEFPANKAIEKLAKMKKGKLEVVGTGGKATEIKFPAGKKKDNK
jgi:hypothetical protein